MKTVLKINNIVVKIEQVLIAASILIMSATLIVNVFGRIFFSKGVYAAEEIGTDCIYVITFIGLSYGATTGKHINMLGLFDMAPKRFQKIDALLISAITAATMGVLTYISFGYVGTLKLMVKVSINLQIPTYIIVAVVSCGLLFAAIQYILIFIRNLQSKEIYLGLDSIYTPDFKREEEAK